MKRWHLTVGVASLILGGMALQQAGDVGVQLTPNPTLGAYLTDNQGKTLYLFTKDTKNTSTCYDQCAENWPPLLVQAKPSAGKGVAASLLGTAQRKDGKLQATYNGLPLYYFAKDAKPGDTTGQGVGDVWFVVSPYGTAIKPTKQATAEAPKTTGSTMADSAEKPELMKQGEVVYSTNCEGCHGNRGQGGAGSPLAGNKKLSDSETVAKQILNGGHIMPPFKTVLLDKEVAAVATYVRNSWGNDFGVILEDQVKKHR